MRIELTKGCTCDSFEVDGVKIMDCDEPQLKHLLINITQKIVSKELNFMERADLEYILMLMVDNFRDTYECSSEPCECCGDYVETYTMKI